MEETSFGRYRLLDLLGRGGMGEVWRAHDTATDRIVAIKLLPRQLANDETFNQRFRREAQVAAQLNDPHVVPIHSYGEIDGRLYVDMRLIEGRDLQAVLASGPLHPSRAVMIVDQVAKALHAAHKVGLVHRDVKPSNILVAEYDFAYLIDFGIARGADQTGLTSTGGMIGTWHYMAPERFRRGGADARADIYALACVLHECLTGSRPYPGDSVEQQIAAHLTAPPPQPSVAHRGVPQSFDAVVAKGMAKDPEERYGTTLELSAAARSAVTTPIASPPPPPPTERIAPRRQEPPRPVRTPTGTEQTLSPDQLSTRRIGTPPPEEPPTVRVIPHGGDGGEPPTRTQGHGATEPPDEAEPPSRRRRLTVIGAVLAVVLLALATTTLLWAARDKPVSGPEIFLEPAMAGGQDPFTPPASTPQPPAAQPGDDPAGKPAPNDEVRTTNGDMPGLYGGTRNLGSCDVELMIRYLAQNPDKAQAWASVFKITPDQIPTVLRELTPVILRTDTRVTNHGFENGKATPRQSVLQAGTAVLVNRYGAPRVRCECGNPLLPPVASATSGAFSGARWTNFSPEKLSLVRASSVVIETLVLYDAATGTYFGRPRGTTGDKDVDDPRAAPPPPPPPGPTPPAPPPRVTNTPVYTPTPSYAPPPTTAYTPPPTTTDTPPTTTYTPPTTTYTPPTTTYEPPTTTYAPPETTYAPPESTYAPPPTTYYAPTPS